jgi:multiple sugar transport system substrate-binding protein
MKTPTWAAESKLLELARVGARRRDLLRAAAAGVTGVAVAGCGVRSEGDAGQAVTAVPVTVTYLRYYNQPDRVEAEQAVFRQLALRYSGLKVDELTVAGTDAMIQQMTAAYAAGNPPDTWTTAATIYHEYVQRGNLLQLDDRMKRDLDPKKYFWETVERWESPAASGKHFGLTRDFPVSILYYNKALFDAARVPYPDGTWSYDTIAKHGPTFAKNQESGETSEWAFIADPTRTNWDPAVRANGGQVLNKQRTRAVVDASPPALATTEQWVAWNQQLRISPPPGHAFFQSYQGLQLRHPFFSGRLAMCQDLTGLIPQLTGIQNSLLKWDVAMVPQGKVKREAYGGSDGQVISKESKNPDMAWRVMMAFNTPESLPFHLAWGGIPFSKDIAALPAWRDKEPKGHTKVLLDTVPFTAGEFNINYNQWQAAKNGLLNQTLQGALSTREAMLRVAAEVNKILVEVYPSA